MDTNFESIKGLAERLVSEREADTVFLYGSRARGDNLADSDWEIGVIFDDKKYIQRSDLAQSAINGAVIYPFRRSEFERGKPNTPFTKSIWMYEIIRTGKTLAGENIIEMQQPPEITRQDLLTDIAFYKARALDAMIAHRAGSLELAKDFYVKSCLLGLRDLILLSSGKFALSYYEIVEKSEAYLPNDYKNLPRGAIDIRTGHEGLTTDLVFQNIGMFTEVIELQINNLQ